MSWPSFFFGLFTALFVFILWRSIRIGRVSCFSLVFDRDGEPIKYWSVLGLFLPLYVFAYFVIVGLRT